MKMRWYWQVILGVAVAVVAIAILGGNGDQPTVSADEPAVTIAPTPYTVVKVKKSFVGWHRVTLEIEADAATTARQQLETMI